VNKIKIDYIKPGHKGVQLLIEYYNAIAASSTHKIYTKSTSLGPHIPYSILCVIQRRCSFLVDSKKVFLHLLCDSLKVSSSFNGGVHSLWISREVSFISCDIKKGVFNPKLLLLIFIILVYF